MLTSATAAEHSGFGEPPMFWILKVLPMRMLPDQIAKTAVMPSLSHRCWVDAMDFVFKQSEAAVMSQKARRRMARQTKMEVVWAGPVVVHVLVREQ